MPLEPPAFLVDSDPIVGAVRTWTGAAVIDLVAAAHGEARMEHTQIMLQRWCTPLEVRMSGDTRWQRFLPEARLWLPGDEQDNEWRGNTRNQFVMLTQERVEQEVERPYHATGFDAWRGRHFDTPALISLLAALAASAADPLHSDTLLSALIGWLADGPAAANAPRRPQRLTPGRVALLKDYIEAHLAEPLSLTRLAALAGCSPRLLGAAFKAGTGRSPHQYVLERRVSEAQLLLSGGCADLSEIAIRVGFADQPQFSKTFRRHTGMTPGAFRRLRGTRFIPARSTA